MDDQKTKVIFRFWGGEVLALFPELPGTRDPYTCESYMHMGQHSAADTDIICETKPATEEEYANLKRELERIGYDLTIIHRHTQRHLAARRAELERMGR